MRKFSDTLIVTMATLLATASYAALAGGKSGGSGDSHPVGAATSASKNAVKGAHIKEGTIRTRKAGSGKVSHSDMNMQKTGDKASPQDDKTLGNIKGESKDDVHKDEIHIEK